MMEDVQTSELLCPRLWAKSKAASLDSDPAADVAKRRAGVTSELPLVKGLFSMEKSAPAGLIL